MQPLKLDLERIVKSPKQAGIARAQIVRRLTGFKFNEKPDEKEASRLRGCREYIREYAHKHYSDSEELRRQYWDGFYEYFETISQN